MREIIRDSLERILVDTCTPSIVRRVEETTETAQLWNQIEESGFLDALIPEHAGGAGLALFDILPIPDLCGRFAVPLPIAETTMLRGLLALAGSDVPAGSLTLAIGSLSAGNAVRANRVPLGRVADYVLVETGAAVRFLPRTTADIGPSAFVLDADMEWDASEVAKSQAISLPVSVRVVQAFIYAAQLGGAFAAVFERTLDFANQRQQFGKPIGKFQAIQHHLALMAEQVFSARMAVELTAIGSGLELDAHRIAVAKARSSEAAVELSALAHAIHGAIGFTEEYDLQLFTRRINAWRLAAGSESYWFAELGGAITADSRPHSLDFLRELNPA